MNLNIGWNYYRNGIRLASSVGIFTLVVSGLLAYFLFSTTLLKLVIFALALGLISGIAVFFLYDLWVHQRLQVLYRITRNIAHKQFEDYENISDRYPDEITHLIKQTIRASKTVEREIQRLNRIENYRKEFIGDISHELKTPIFAIQGFIETLLNGAIDDDEVNRDFLTKTMRNVNRLIYLTKDLMEISKLETGELKSERTLFDIGEVLQETADNLQYKAENEGISMQLTHLEDDAQVFADRNQVKQVLINLIENAIKYNKPNGEIYLSVKPYNDKADKVLVSVEDTGIGIDQKHIQRVTERFFRVDKSRSRAKGGTGLGLSIVKHIMESHGEEFFIESTPQEGSTFSFTLTCEEESIAA